LGGTWIPAFAGMTGVLQRFLGAVVSIRQSVGCRMTKRIQRRTPYRDAFIAQERKSWAQIVKAAGLSLE